MNKVDPKLNGSIYASYKILKNVVSLATECEIVVAFENGQDAIVIHRILINIGYP